MALSEIIVKIIGIILAVVGFALLLTVAGIHILGIGTENIWLSIILGFIFLGIGIYIIRGGTITI